MKNKYVTHDRAEIWENYDPSNLISRKTEIVKSYIPKDINTIIDVGCGNGIITNILNKEYDVTGVDMSAIALSYVKGKKIQSSSDSIPVDDSSFDMVFSSEMLEHLPDDVLSKTVEEFRRIAKNYVFITVPNKEHLATSNVKCRNCGYVFHPYGHIQIFNIDRIKNLFCDDFELIQTGVHGQKKRYYNVILLKIKNHIADRWFDTKSEVVCPNCDYKFLTSEKGNFLSKACNLTNRLIGTKRKYWLFALFKRK